MAITLSDEARRAIGVFERETDAHAVDCLLETETAVFVVPPDEMATAIGPGGKTVEALERRLDARVVLVEDAERAEPFVANALAPAAIYDVHIETDGDDRVAVASVDPDDMGVAIGREGERIERARQLANRHFELTDVRVEATE